MKYFLIIGLLVISTLLLTTGLRTDDTLENRYGRLPIQTHGRIQPIDSLARQTLRLISGKSTLHTLEGKTLQASAWMLAMTTRPLEADALPAFRIDHPYIKGLLGFPIKEKHFSFQDILPHWDFLQSQFERLPPNAQDYNTQQRALAQFRTSLSVYQSLKRLLGDQQAQSLQHYHHWQSLLKDGKIAFRQWENKEPYHAENLEAFTQATRLYLYLSLHTRYGIIPIKDHDKWMNIGEAMLSGLQEGVLPPIVLPYMTLAEANAKGDTTTAFHATGRLLELLKPSGKVRLEYALCQYAPFLKGCIFYIMSLLLVSIYWLTQYRPLRKSAIMLCAIGFLLHTIGLLLRMYLQGRPPVTNLYSSALFIGWAGVGLGLVLERLSRQGLGVFVASILGSATLIIAHNLANSGIDTLEQMRAVLDSNFWLSTHVIAITLGYASMFLCGTFGIVYAIGGYLKPSFDIDTFLYRTVYGITCFSLFFSFLGTMLGGIWADESWGRFWGWDPKENGALMIVLWCAIMLHAKWGKLVEKRGLMILAIGGNIVTAWSWFGVNLLGVGLHSYGFTEGGGRYLGLFALSQIFLMALAFFRPLKTPKPASI